MGVLRASVPGIGITLMVAVISFLTSSIHPSFDALVISIIFGMLVANMFDNREVFDRGVNIVLKTFLPIGIGFYGMQLVFSDSEMRLLPAVIGVFILVFGVTYFISRGFGLGRRLSVLLSTGMSVCGASAIVVIAPLINVKREDTSISIISVMTVGLTGMLIYRFLYGTFGLPMENFAFLSGTTLPMFGQVKVASSAMGQESLLMASNFKLLRVSALAVLAGAALVFLGREKKRFYVPWFMVLFFILAVAVNVSEKVASVRGVFETISKFSLSFALSAIGLSLDFNSITDKGASPLFAVFLSWGIIVLTIYLVFSVTA
jgi:uncharacterized integral membrane protein (TIGR00698 family)